MIATSLDEGYTRKQEALDKIVELKNTREEEIVIQKQIEALKKDVETGSKRGTLTAKIKLLKSTKIRDLFLKLANVRRLTDQEIELEIKRLEELASSLDVSIIIYSEVLQYLQELIGLGWKEVDERRNWARNEFILRIGNVTGNFQNAFKIELSSKALVAAGKDEEETIVSSLEGWDVISRIEGKWKQRGARDIYNEVMATESVYLPESEYRSDNDAFYGTWRAHDLSDLFLEDENSRPIIENVILEDCRNLREKIISGGTIFSRESESAVGVNFLSRNARGIISTAVVLLIFLAAGWMFTSARNAFEKYVSFETIPAAGDDAAHKGERAPPSEAEEDQPTIAEQISELTRALNDILGETDISDQNIYSSEVVVRINEIKNKLKELEEEHVVLYGAIKTVQDKAESWKYASGHIDGMQGLQALSSEREPVIGPGFQSLNMPSIPGYWGTMDESLGGKMPMCSTETDIVKEDKDMGVPVIGFITVNP